MPNSAFWVGVHQQYLFALHSKAHAQILAGGGLAGATFLVDNSDYSCFWGHIVLLPFHHSFIVIILIDVMMDVCCNLEVNSGKYWAYRLP